MSTVLMQSSDEDKEEAKLAVEKEMQRKKDNENQPKPIKGSTLKSKGDYETPIPEDKMEIDKKDSFANRPIDNEKTISENDWKSIKQTALNLASKYKFIEANEYLNGKIVSVDLSKLKGKETIQRFHEDMNILSMIENNNTLIVDKEAEVEVTNEPELIRTMATPELAIYATLGMPLSIMSETILHQESLAPITMPGTEIVIENFRDYKGEYSRMLETVYPESNYLQYDLKLEGFPLQVIVIENKEKEYVVWRIYQDKKGKAPYKSVKFWKDYYGSLK